MGQSVYAVEASNLSFRYHGAENFTAPFSFDLQQGKAALVCGNSGTGKSTMARCICGLIPHLYNGELQGLAKLFGMQTTATPLYQLSKRTGFLFQNPYNQHLMPKIESEILFGLESLGVAEKEAKLRLDQVVQLFDLEGFLQRNPNSLSGGEQQKLALACVLARKPDLLVLDEPLSMLDTSSASNLVSCLKKYAQSGGSVLCFEQKPEYFGGWDDLQRLWLSNSCEKETAADLLSSFCPAPGQIIDGIETRSLRLTYANKAVIDGIDLSLPSGKLIALIGPNGSGKTSLLRVLAGFQKSQGEYFIAGQTSGQQNKPRLNMVAQNPDMQLFCPTVKQEMLFGLQKLNCTIYTEILRALNLNVYENSQPLLLSEGEKRRVALATAIMHQQSSGLLLDEPSLGQDSSHKQMLLCILRRLAECGWFILFATHDLELAKEADWMLAIKEGKIIRQGQPKKLMKTNELWDELGLVLPPWLYGSADET
ncbi:MAG: ABC transporter ATP-binding protein [Anaerolineaceae bacterium]|nr:ABC transporter ATP-binding protein [Anaerolineaceae bacterium]